ncbi:MAG: hypothetical protein J6C90_00910 [Clostridia bacterium]|nr:hypothetical protein [Clostridia bacterium]
MLDTIYHYLTNFIRGMDHNAYVFVVCVLFIISLTFMKNFLKANKGDTTKFNKFSSIVGVALCLGILVGISSLR